MRLVPCLMILCVAIMMCGCSGGDSPKTALGSGGKQSASQWVTILKDKNTDWGQRFDACKALGEMGPEAKEAVPALIEVAKDDKPAVRQMAVNALGKIGPDAKEAIPALKEIAEEGIPGLSQDADTAVKKIKSKPTTE